MEPADNSRAGQSAGVRIRGGRPRRGWKGRRGWYSSRRAGRLSNRPTGGGGPCNLRTVCRYNHAPRCCRAIFIFRGQNPNEPNTNQTKREQSENSARGTTRRRFLFVDEITPVSGPRNPRPVFLCGRSVTTRIRGVSVRYMFIQRGGKTGTKNGRFPPDPRPPEGVGGSDFYGKTAHNHDPRRARTMSNFQKFGAKGRTFRPPVYVYARFGSSVPANTRRICDGSATGNGIFWGSISRACTCVSGFVRGSFRFGRFHRVRGGLAVGDPVRGVLSAYVVANA